MLSLSDLRKRFKTPEFVENNGGWGPFIFFVGVPAFLAIFGLIDPIFDWFLSLFSIEAGGHIKTYWEVKYVLFFVFFFFIPGSIYLLYIRLNPRHLKRKAEQAYGLISEEVSRIYAQMYGPPDTARHNLQKLYFIYRVDPKYGLRCDGKIALLAKQDLHFWKYGVGAEPEGDGQEFIADIDFVVGVAGGSSAFLPLKDETHEKEVVVVFLPYVQQGNTCEVNVSWNWPKCMGQLRDKGEEEYGWTCESFDPNCEGVIHVEYIFDKKLGDIQCLNVGINPPGAQLQRAERQNEIIWTFDVPKAPLGKGKEYRLVFKRR